MNLDPRQLQKFMRMPGFVASLSTESYQTAQYRVLTAKWTPDMRITWGAVQEGYTSMDSLPLATGLTTAQLRTAVNKLQDLGYLKQIVVTSEPLEVK